MKIGPVVILFALALTLAAPAMAQSGKLSGKAQPSQKRRPPDLEKIERGIFSHLDLNGGQKGQVDQLMATTKARTDAVEGKGLVPHDKRADAAALQKIAHDYAMSVKKILTPTQFKRYLRMKANVAYALTHRPQRVHF